MMRVVIKSSAIRFCLAGASSLLLDILVLSALLPFLGYASSRVIASIISLAYSYVVTCKFVFPVALNIKTFCTYFSGISIAYFLSLSTSLAIPMLWPHMYAAPRLNIFIGASIAALFNFLYQRRFLITNN
tara:strand:- start:129 stop:518 length:390 start_codon:yes stop_codon:yes gene_type:complete